VAASRFGKGRLDRPSKFVNPKLGDRLEAREILASSWPKKAIYVSSVEPALFFETSDHCPPSEAWYVLGKNGVKHRIGSF
jgi:hypothetical protein